MVNNPSLNPADNNSLAGALRFAFSKMIQDINGMLPARVISYDRDTNRAEVQLLISLITTSGASVPRPAIASVPVLLLGGGGLFISFPLNSGDLGWVIANDRDISNFLSTYSTSIPNTNRISKFSDGLFVPDVMRGYTLAGDADGAMVIQNLDGSVSVAISDTDIIISAADTVTINAGHNVNINALANSVVTLAGGLGTLGVVGNITATGSITPSTPPPPP